jgi:hypothetical protein
MDIEQLQKILSRMDNISKQLENIISTLKDKEIIVKTKLSKRKVKSNDSQTSS